MSTASAGKSVCVCLQDSDRIESSPKQTAGKIFKGKMCSYKLNHF